MLTCWSSNKVVKKIQYNFYISVLKYQCLRIWEKKVCIVWEVLSLLEKIWTSDRSSVEFFSMSSLVHMSSASPIAVGVGVRSCETRRKNLEKSDWFSRETLLKCDWFLKVKIDVSQTFEVVGKIEVTDVQLKLCSEIILIKLNIKMVVTLVHSGGFCVSQAPKSRAVTSFLWRAASYAVRLTNIS